MIEGFWHHCASNRYLVRFVWEVGGKVRCDALSQHPCQVLGTESARRRLGSCQRRLSPARSSSSIRKPLILNDNRAQLRLLASTLTARLLVAQSRLSTIRCFTGMMPRLVARPMQEAVHLLPFPRMLSTLIPPGTRQKYSIVTWRTTLLRQY